MSCIITEQQYVLATREPTCSLSPTRQQLDRISTGFSKQRGMVPKKQNGANIFLWHWSQALLLCISYHESSLPWLRAAYPIHPVLTHLSAAKMLPLSPLALGRCLLRTSARKP